MTSPEPLQYCQADDTFFIFTGRSRWGDEVEGIVLTVYLGQHNYADEELRLEPPDLSRMVVVTLRPFLPFQLRLLNVPEGMDPQSFQLRETARPGPSTVDAEYENGGWQIRGFPVGNYRFQLWYQQKWSLWCEFELIEAGQVVEYTLPELYELTIHVPAATFGEVRRLRVAGHFYPVHDGVMHIPFLPAGVYPIRADETGEAIMQIDFSDDTEVTYNPVE